MSPDEVTKALQRVINIRASVAKVYGEDAAVVAELMFHTTLIIGLASEVIKELDHGKCNAVSEELCVIASVATEKVATRLGVRDAKSLEAFTAFDQLLKELLS